jgi:hypothetical protein
VSLDGIQRTTAGLESIAAQPQLTSAYSPARPRIRALRERGDGEVWPLCSDYGRFDLERRPPIACHGRPFERRLTRFGPPLGDGCWMVSMCCRGRGRRRRGGVGAVGGGPAARAERRGHGVHLQIRINGRSMGGNGFPIPVNRSSRSWSAPLELRTGCGDRQGKRGLADVSTNQKHKRTFSGC